MTIRCSKAFKEAIDRLRKREADLPSRTVMLHRLVERSIEARDAKEATE